MRCESFTTTTALPNKKINTHHRPNHPVSLVDILGTGFKYIEGVVVEDPDCAEWVSGSGANTTCSASNCLCRAKASGAYSASSLKVKDACNHLLSWAFTTQSSAAFLFLVWLNDTLSSTMKMRVSGNRSVMSSLEYQVRARHETTSTPS